MGSKSLCRPKWVRLLVFLSKPEMIRVVGGNSKTQHFSSLIVEAVQQGPNSS